jgi:hypothetical protein
MGKSIQIDIVRVDENRFCGRRKLRNKIGLALAITPEDFIVIIRGERLADDGKGVYKGESSDDKQRWINPEAGFEFLDYQN